MVQVKASRSLTENPTLLYHLEERDVSTADRSNAWKSLSPDRVQYWESLSNYDQVRAFTYRTAFKAAAQQEQRQPHLQLQSSAQNAALENNALSTEHHGIVPATIGVSWVNGARSFPKQIYL